jgi:transcriptional regulator GlxA family with amidase domain
VPHDVAVLAFPGISPFHLSVPSLVFTADTDDVPLDYRVAVCAVEPGAVATRAGFDLAVPRGLEELATAHTIVVPSWDPDLPVPPELVEALRAAHARGARLVALCLGAFVLAATGLVDGRELTTHWHAAGELAARYPQVRVPVRRALDRSG